MRYYEILLGASEKTIKENATIKLRDYDYDSPIGAMNKYMYQKMKNGVSFLAYREEDNDILRAVFSYDESSHSLDDTCEYLSEIIGDVFCIKRIMDGPYEITAGQFFEDYLEARRRSYGGGMYRITDAASLTFYEECYRRDDMKKAFHFDFAEKLISENKVPNLKMYDKSFQKELSNITAHKNDTDQKGNLVHYVISSRSMEAASDMAETLLCKLYEANRIRTKRMIIVSEIWPDFYKESTSKYLEEIIKNNFGGAVVIDLSEKFGHDVVKYGPACEYLEKLIKRYRNDCLFIFTYNMDKPGFSYSILPKLSKYLIPVMLREGTSNRKAAVSYMQQLIKASEYGQYAEQAEEFMKRFPGNKFTQTDVLMAYEQFESWCINKNIMKAYNYENADDFLLDRDENAESAWDKLNNMIGLKLVKEQVKIIIAADVVEKERKKRSGSAYQSGTMHMIFSGNPGSAKTTVAKLFAGIAKEKGILKSGAFVECPGTELIFADDVQNAFEAAKGGVLFIDEAYAIVTDMALTVLLQEMENRRDEVIVILAGYNERMQDFMKRNEGLKSRIPYWIDFPDYDEKELTDIFKMMLKERGFTAAEEAIKEACYLFEKARYADDFGNGRYVRNLLERAINNQAVRLTAVKENVSDISKKELFLIKKEDVATQEEGFEDRRVEGTALKELEEMVGLSSVKSVIKKAIAGFKFKKYCIKNGIHKDKASLHMVFTGNPGTAKTTVARLFAEILKDENVLPTGKFVEVGRADLVGQFIGQTAPIIKKKFREAKGGVLFIDEAYSLCDGYSGGYGEEAINTIVQEMENHREDTIVIFAGYPMPMKDFLGQNPGMASRIAFNVNFEDYSTDELCDITKLMLSKKKMTITDAAMNKLRDGYEVAGRKRDYGNGRFVRKVLEEAEMNLADRISAMNEAEITKELITTLEECDIPDVSTKNRPIKKIGFSVG